jgi:DNA repair protein RadC
MVIAVKVIKDLPEIDRPREKLLSKGATALSDPELLAILLGSGMKGTNALSLATKIIHKVDLRSGKLDALILKQIPGVGPTKAARIIAAYELARRFMLSEGSRVREAKDVLPFVQQIRDKRQEYFVCLSLSGANEVIENRVVTVGLLDSNQVHPREVYADPLTDRAASIIVAHNHPSGTLEASPEDIALTDRLARAGKLLGIPLLDHIIVTSSGYLSLKQAGYM